MGEYALPALGLLAVASLVGPLVGGLVMGALSLGVMLAAGEARAGCGGAAHPPAPHALHPGCC